MNRQDMDTSCHLGFSIARRLTYVCAVGICCAVASTDTRASPQVTEELFALGTFPMPHLLRLDPTTGQVLEAHRAELPGGYLWHGLAFDGSQFLAPAIRGGNHPSYTTWLGPSSGRQGAPLLVSGQFDNMSYDFNPITGEVWGIGQQSLVGGGATVLCRIDQTTGAASVVGPILGATSFATGIAFDHTGRCLITDAFGPRVMTLDLATHVATVIGDLGLGSGYFDDITLSQQNELWGSFTSQDISARGIYRIDLSSLTHVRVNSVTSPHGGLAFARYPTPVTLCPGKVNSQGCVPTIEVAGYPSASGNLGFWIRARNVVNRKQGVLLMSVSGAASLPLGGGTLCISPPLYSPLPRHSGGNAIGSDCSGMWEIDLLPEIRRREHHGVPPAFPAGQVIGFQWYGRDPALGQPNPISLSSAIEVTLMP